LFLNEVSDATPLRDRNRTPSVRTRASRALPASDSEVRCAIDRDGERVEGRAHGVSRQQLADLRAGRIRPEATLDLHRQAADSARRKLRRFLEDSAAVHRRCVLVIHGRGLHSGDAPVLKDRVVEWLAASRVPIRGFCTARPGDGGTGALYVLLEGA